MGTGADLNASLSTAPTESFNYQWARNGADIAGATASSYMTTAVADYSCRSRAPTLPAAPPRAAPPTKFAIQRLQVGKLSETKNNGTATTGLTVPALHSHPDWPRMVTIVSRPPHMRGFEGGPWRRECTFAGEGEG